VEGEKADRRKFKSYPIGYFHIDIAEVRTEEGRLYLFVVREVAAIRTLGWPGSGGLMLRGRLGRCAARERAT
jgi:hypothetical protein